MKTIYRSKIGPELIILLSAGMLPGVITAIADKNPDVLLAVCMGVLFAIILFALATTRYVIDGQMLRIYVLIFQYRPIDITTITGIKETNNPLSAPAASLDRLEIKYGKKNILVSPKDKKGFMASLQRINPNINYQG